MEIASFIVHRPFDSGHVMVGSATAVGILAYRKHTIPSIIHTHWMSFSTNETPSIRPLKTLTRIWLLIKYLKLITMGCV